MVVYGDSSCLEGGSSRPCHWLLLAALQYALGGHLPASLRDAAAARRRDVHLIPSGEIILLYILCFVFYLIDGWIDVC